MRREVLSLVAVLGIAACGSPAAQKDKDPKAPAVEPAVVNVPIDVPTPDIGDASEKPSLIPKDQMQRITALSQGYSLATATIINQDGRMLGQLYAPDAVLHVPDSTVTGLPNVVRAWLTFSRNKSLTDFQRTSKGQRVIDDSTLADSGIYQMTFKRTARDSVIERGEYKATWRVRQGIDKWIILEDAVRPKAAPRQKPAK